MVQVLCFSFNQEGGCLCIGTNKGFSIYQAGNFKLRYQADIGGVSCCEILGSSNIVALVGAGEDPELSQKKLMLYDIKKKRKVGEIFHQDAKILNVKLSFSILAIATSSSCYIYNFPKIKLARTIRCFNPNGVIALTSNIDFNYFACVNRIKSKSVENKSENVDVLEVSYVPDLVGLGDNKSASWESESDISLITFNYTGNLLAAACSQGKYISILKVPSLSRLITLHRGMSPVTIYQLSFSKESNYILNSSSSGTLHIYDISSAVSSETLNDLHGNFSMSKIAHTIYQGAKSLIGGTSEEVNCSILKYNYPHKDRKFVGVFTHSNRLVYILDDEAVFTELRIQEGQFSPYNIKASEVLKGTELD